MFSIEQRKFLIVVVSLYAIVLISQTHGFLKGYLAGFFTLFWITLIFEVFHKWKGGHDAKRQGKANK